MLYTDAELEVLLVIWKLAWLRELRAGVAMLQKKLDRASVPLQMICQTIAEKVFCL